MDDDLAIVFVSLAVLCIGAMAFCAVGFVLILLFGTFP